MSPIIDLQRRMVEVGRIRMGKKGNKGQPQKLDTWRLTSRDQARINEVARLYGGDVHPWAERDGEYECITTTSELPILILPGQTLSQWYEVWSAGGCQRRCDGEREVISDGACVCDQEDGERTCKPTTRLSVMIPDVPGLGVWRLESHGYYAAVELAGTAGMLEQATARGQLLPARLRIDQRRKVEGGKTTRYAVPVIDIDITVREALPLAASAPELAYTPARRELAPVTIEQGLAGAEASVAPTATTGRSAAPIPAAETSLFGDAPVPVPEETPPAGGPSGPDVPAGTAQGSESPPSASSPAVINHEQFAQFTEKARAAGLTRGAVKKLVEEQTGQDQVTGIPADRFAACLAALDRVTVEA